MGSPDCDSDLPIVTRESTAEDALAAAWHDLSVRYHRVSCALDRELQSRHQLTSSEFEVLELLCRADDHKSRMSALAEHVHLTQSALSRVVAGLERDGLVSRTMCTSDRRSVFAALTQAGSERYDQARPTQRAVLSDNAIGCQDLVRDAQAVAAARSQI
ncbi:MarR family winged helix-turn-helix transcriptional regulator [Gordonia soli]|uniref:Putative MarR family transcriptional regulator n=1 Tax=Gordonia soli NBRC 108243 TaxID=1223545 RepID=M0QMN4_9ACTN|nr:MarR family transcriptional regulator [Gordonia soli]GAC69895.1 putative MarR family transcriptional regulator [Gordonia soli NBRC 108243]